jgi:hypothetical protein
MPALQQVHIQNCAQQCIHQNWAGQTEKAFQFEAAHPVVDTNVPTNRGSESVKSFLPPHIIQLLQSVKQPNDKRAWTLEQDIKLVEQASKSIPYKDIHVDGKLGEHTVAHRAQISLKIGCPEYFL